MGWSDCDQGGICEIVREAPHRKESSMERKMGREVQCMSKVHNRDMRLIVTHDSGATSFQRVERES